jgi:ActR/RegA family two-component response regulator
VAKPKTTTARKTTFDLDKDAGHKPRILIVEDDLNYAFNLMRALKEPAKNLFFEVDVVRDALNAMPYLQRDSIDIYVVDLCLKPDEKNASARVESAKQLIEDDLLPLNAPAFG